MRRADRLFQIVQFLRSRRLTTAQWLASRLDVSVRTIYRDIQDLSLSGVPIEGEAGVGYMLRHSMDLPPLMFERSEIEALAIGARMVNGWGDPELQRAAESALAKIHSVIPPDLRAELNRSRMFVPGTTRLPVHHMAKFREAIRAQHKLRLTYRDEHNEVTERCVWPLALFFWGQVWTLCGWCELREDFRSFRVDRVLELAATGETFPAEPGKRLEDYLSRYPGADLLVPQYR